MYKETWKTWFPSVKSPAATTYRNASIYADDTHPLYVYMCLKKMKNSTWQHDVQCIAEIRTWMATSKLRLNDDKNEFLAICV